MSAPAGGVVPAFFDFRGGAETGPLLDGLAGFAPDVVVVFRPHTLPPGTMDEVPAPVLGYLTEPLPHAGLRDHAELLANLAAVRAIDRGNVDRVISFDPTCWDTAAPLMPLWRSMPLPVDDRIFRSPEQSARPPRLIFIGHSSWNREETLLSLKHEFDLRHYSHALLGEELAAVLADADVGINVHSAQWVHAMESQVLVHLAAGHLLLSQPLETGFGLEPNVDYLEFFDRHDLSLRVHQLMAQPDAFDRIRVRGNHTAQQYRASRVWPRVLRDLIEDLRVFGTERAGCAATPPARGAA